MNTDKPALDGYGFMSRPKTGSAPRYSKKILPLYVKLLRHPSKTINAKCGWLLQDCVSSQALWPPARPTSTRSITLCFTAVCPEICLGRDRRWKKEEGQANLSPKHHMKPIHWWLNSEHKCDPLSIAKLVCNILLSSLPQPPKYKNTFKEMINPKVEYNAAYEESWLTRLDV